MKRTYTEKQVLKKLDIPDFRHMTKDKIIEFASELSKMDPEVAKKALEQFPDFAGTTLELVKEYRIIVQQMLDDDREGAQNCYDMYTRVMDVLEDMLHQEDLTFEQEKYILEQMKEVADAMAEKDREKSNNRLKVLGMVTTTVAWVVSILGAALGAVAIMNNSNNLLEEDEDEEDDDDE